MISDTKEKIKIMQASLEGDIIQCKSKHPSKNMEWMSIDPTWDWKNYDYRVKPEPSHCLHCGSENIRVYVYECIDCGRGSGQ